MFISLFINLNIMKKLVLSVLMSFISLAIIAQVEISCGIYQNNCRLGVGTPNPGEKIHLADGNFLIEGGGETAIIMKRDFSITGGPSGISTNPIFYMGRIIQAGDGDPEFRILYKDDLLTSEIPIMEFDRKGIIASVKPSSPSILNRGSHFEGFYRGAEYPYFRLNSYPRMRLEMGEGGNKDVDVAVERFSRKKLGFYTGSDCRVVIDSIGQMGIGTQIPKSKVEIANGDLLISNQANGFILTSPTGIKWRIKVNDAGELIREQVSINKVEIDDRIKIYPNPSADKITVDLANSIDSYVDLEILNLNGKMIFMKEYNSNTIEVDISDFTTGMYILNIKDNKGNLIQTKKVIKK
jgi:hypothetical protein